MKQRRTKSELPVLLSILQPESDKKIKQHIFVVNNKELRKILLSVFHLINDFVEIIKSPDTINFKRLKKKFTSADGKSIKVSF